MMMLMMMMMLLLMMTRMSGFVCAPKLTHPGTVRAMRLLRPAPRVQGRAGKDTLIGRGRTPHVRLWVWANSRGSLMRPRGAVGTLCRRPSWDMSNFVASCTENPSPWVSGPSPLGAHQTPPLPRSFSPDSLVPRDEYLARVPRCCP